MFENLNACSPRLHLAWSRSHELLESLRWGQRMDYTKGIAITAGVRAQEQSRYRHLRWPVSPQMWQMHRSQRCSLGAAAGSKFNISANGLYGGRLCTRWQLLKLSFWQGFFKCFCRGWCPNYANVSVTDPGLTEYEKRRKFFSLSHLGSSSQCTAPSPTSWTKNNSWFFQRPRACSRIPREVSQPALAFGD